MTGNNEAWIQHLPAFLREKLHGRVQLQKILSNIIWLSLDKVLRLGVGAVVGIWMARYLGPAQFGLLNYAGAFAALFSPLATLGLDSILVRDILAEEPEGRRSTLGTAFAFRLAGAAGGAAGATALMLVLRPSDGIAIALVALAGMALLAQAFDVIDLWFQSQVKAKFAIYAKNGTFLFVTGVRVVMLVAHAPLMAFAWAGLAEALLGAAALVVVYHWRGERVRRWRVRVTRARILLRDSWPLAFANLAVIVYMRIGQVMLGSIMTDREVGIYSVAVRLAEAWYFIPTAIAASVFPSILKARQESAALYTQRMQILYGTLSAVSLIVAVATSFFSNMLITLLFGAQYAEAGPVLAVYIWASVPVFLTVASNQYLIAENKTRVALFRTVAGSVVNVVLNLVLIPSLGMVGAAIAALAAYVVATFSMALTKELRTHMAFMGRSLNPAWLYRTLRETGGG